MKEPVIISARNLDIGYGTKTILTDINLTLHPGKLTCFMGPNGSGKTTLLRTICGFQPPLSGQVLFNDKDINSLSRKKQAAIYSVVLTDRIQSDYMNGRELVATGRLPHTGWLGRLSIEDETAIDKALELTSTGDLADKWLYQLSDGQRQKLMIARALSQETPVIILDEPTAHLDLNNRVNIVTLLRKLAHDHGRTILMATHELDLALQLADRLWLAETGKHVLEGIPEDLVLDGRLDKVFQFKGYDLKSGQVEMPKSGRTVHLSGEGPVYLWTKNALERNGYTVTDSGDAVVRIIQDGSRLQWELNERGVSASLEALMEMLAEVT